MLMQQYLLYMDMLTSGFINCSKIWQDLFRLWIKEIQSTIDRGNYQSKASLLKLFSDPEMQFFSFNYTKTLQKLYGVKKVIHIHNRVGQKLIFGHDKNDEVGLYQNMDYEDGPNISSSFLDDMVLSFKKDTASPMKKYANFFRSLNCNIDRVYSYGFSYGKVDRGYIKEIISRISENTLWLFTEHEAHNHEALRIKKIKLRRYGFRGSFGIYDG